MDNDHTTDNDLTPRDTDIHDIFDLSNFAEEENNAIIKVVGVGGGGCNAVSYMYKQHIPHINFVVCNTDRQALEGSPVPNKILLGDGLGAGNRPEVGRKCAEDGREKIATLFTDKTEMVFITAGMGGGTGTGAAPVVAEIAKDAGMLTIGIVTVPFLFEGKKKIFKALDGAEEMKKHVDALLIINNENLVELYKDLNLFNAFEKADDTLANAARSISEIISDRCYINVDFQDVKTTLRDSGTAIIATAVGEGEHRITDALEKALASPLLKSHDIYTSKRLLFKFMCSKESERPIQTSEIQEITQFTSQLPASIDVKWGIGDDPSLGDTVKVTVLASGFDVTIHEGDTAPGKKGTVHGPIVMGADAGNPADDEASKAANKALDDVYGGEKIKQHNRDAAKLRYAVLKPSQFDDYEVISLLERTPAFNRPANFNTMLGQVGEAQPPREKPSAQDAKGDDLVITF